MLYMAQRIFLEHTKIKMKTRLSNTILIVGPESSFFDKKLEENNSQSPDKAMHGHLFTEDE